MARALAAAIVASLLTVSGAVGSRAVTPQRGGTVVVAGGFHLSCLNPLLDACSPRELTHSGLPLPLIQTLEGDYRIGPDLAYRPDLVASVTWTKRPPWRLTYHIRPNARWSDGVQVTSSDFVFTFNAFLKTLKLLSDDPVRAVRRVRAIDAKTFRVTLRSRSAQWRYTFYIVLPKHALAGADLSSIWRDTIDVPKTGDPIGSGPFLVKSFDQQTGDLTLGRNPRYWEAHSAYLDGISFRDVPDPVAALRNGDVDLVPDLAPADFLRLRNQPGITVAATPGQFWMHLEIRVGPGGNPVLQNRLVRQAVAYGIDRDAIVRSLFANTDPRLRPVQSSVFLSQSRYYRPVWRDYRYRPGKARQLLEAAGCRRGPDTVYVCGGNRLSLRFLTTTGHPDRQQAFDLMQEQLRRVGIEVKPGYAPPGAFFGQILPGGDFDVALVGWDYASELFYRYSIFACRGGVNWTGYCNPAVTRELRTSTRLLDLDARANILRRVDLQMARDVPVIPLYQLPHFFAYRTALNGVADNPVEGLTSNSENWWLER